MCTARARSVKGRRCTLVSPVTARTARADSDFRELGTSAFSYTSPITTCYSIASECAEQTLAQMALAWVLRSVRVTSVTIGASRVSQIEENVKALEHAEFSAEIQPQRPDCRIAAIGPFAISRVTFITNDKKTAGHPADGRMRRSSMPSDKMAAFFAHLIIRVI